MIVLYVFICFTRYSCTSTEVYNVLTNNIITINIYIFMNIIFNYLGRRGHILDVGTSGRKQNKNSIMSYNFLLYRIIYLLSRLLYALSYYKY